MEKYDRCEIMKSVDSWFNNNNYPRFSKIIGLCSENKDIDMLNLITLKLYKIIKMENPIDLVYNDDKIDEEKIEDFVYKVFNCNFSNSQFRFTFEEKIKESNSLIKASCYEAIRMCIAKLLELDNTSILIGFLMKCDDDKVRRYLVYEVDDYSTFLNDDNERIRKIATIRNNFDYMWNNDFSSEDKDVVNCINDLIKSGSIELWDGLVGQEDDLSAEFKGSIIKNQRTGYIDFDRDIFKYLDRKILSCFVSKYTIIGDYNLDIPFDRVLNNKQKTI